MTMNRRYFLGAAGAGVLGAFGKENGSAETQTSAKDKPQQIGGRRPNLIYFMPDEMRADSLGCYGNPVTRTPNLDRLAHSGARFSNCHVQYPVCGASRCSLLTGWPTSVRGHRSLFYFLRPEEPNLFRYLRRAGYDVFWFGKNDALAAASFYDSVTRWNEAGGTGRGHRTDATPGVLSMLQGPGGSRTDTGDYLNLKSAFEVIGRSEAERPFCIFLPLSEPHPPYTVPEDFYNMYAPASLPPLIPANLPRKPDFHAGIREMYGLTKLGDTELRRVRSVYYGQVSYSDWLFGELLEQLQKTGREKDTAVFVFSDHGDYAGDFGLVEKWPSGLEDCLTHVPLLARVPGGREGVVGDDMVELYDVMQTSLELAGTTAQHTHFARSLLPQITGGAGDEHRAAFAEGGYNVYEPQCFEPVQIARSAYEGKVRLENERPETVSRCAMIRTRTHKLIRRPQGISELYDLQKDPKEADNLYGETSVSGIQERLQTQLLDHFLNTSGIAPMDKDPRPCPPFSPTPTGLSTGAETKRILDAQGRS